MREIIFRAKRIKNDEWVCGSLLKDGEAHRPGDVSDNIPFSDYYIVPKTKELDNINTCLSNGAYMLNTIAYHIHPKTVGQYTGLNDKNGTKIFEDDIVLMPKYGGGKHKAVVYFKNGKFAVDGSNYSFKDICCKNIEVVGNIHDNPELLKAGE